MASKSQKKLQKNFVDLMDALTAENRKRRKEVAKEAAAAKQLVEEQI